MAEIKIDFLKLYSDIARMKAIERESDFKIYMTSALINHSLGKMADNTNELYKRLMEVEDVLVEIVRSTNIVLTNVGIDFQEVQKNLVIELGKLGNPNANVDVKEWFNEGKKMGGFSNTNNMHDWSGGMFNE